MAQTPSPQPAQVSQEELQLLEKLAKAYEEFENTMTEIDAKQLELIKKANEIYKQGGMDNVREKLKTLFE